MRYVIIRDDDTNAFTPVKWLDALYRPMLEQGLPVNLATIPEVSSQARMSNGEPEGFLVAKNGTRSDSMPIGANRELVEYLQSNPNYHIVQHGCYHDYLEFDRSCEAEVIQRLEHGTRRLMEAGFPKPETFVAPYDKLSRVSLRAVSERFRVLSTGWFELRRLPYSWWPGYAVKKFRGDPHWQIGQTLLLSHPGCLLSYHRTFSRALQGIVHCVERNRVTVLVTHWWEYFRTGEPDGPFIDFLHETLRHLAKRADVKIISFEDLATGTVQLQ
ncbi:MAG TPA: DUF2334 domain-containing protein [Verrucomicrobiae bacterium]|nr:DUF2334 domain-containing protein [Verrucomicrobiae bacterium]